MATGQSTTTPEADRRAGDSLHDRERERDDTELTDGDSGKNISHEDQGAAQEVDEASTRARGASHTHP